MTRGQPCTLLDWLPSLSLLSALFPLFHTWHLSEWTWIRGLTFPSSTCWYDLLSFLTGTMSVYSHSWLHGRPQSSPHFYYFGVNDYSKPTFCHPVLAVLQRCPRSGHWMQVNLLKLTFSSVVCVFFLLFFFQAHWTEGKWHLITGEQSRSSANYDPGSSVIISN